MVVMTRNPESFKRRSFKLLCRSCAIYCITTSFACTGVKNQLYKFVGGETVNKLATYAHFFLKSRSFTLSLFECRNLRSESNSSLKMHSKKSKYNLYISFATNKFRSTVK